MAWWIFWNFPTNNTQLILWYRASICVYEQCILCVWLTHITVLFFFFFFCFCLFVRETEGQHSQRHCPLRNASSVSHSSTKLSYYFTTADSSHFLKVAGVPQKYYSEATCCLACQLVLLLLLPRRSSGSQKLIERFPSHPPWQCPGRFWSKSCRNPSVTLLGPLHTYVREEPVVSHRWSGWVCERTGWSWRLQENYRSFKKNLQNIPQMNESKIGICQHVINWI